MQKNEFPKNWVILRGLVRGRIHWKGFDQLIKDKWQLENVFTPELPGNGYLAEQWTPATMEGAVKSLREQCRLPANTAIGILGISLGGMIATRWAQLYPDEISHLVVGNSSSKLSPFYKRLRPQNYLRILKLLTNTDAEHIERFIFEVTTTAKEKWPIYLPENIDFHKKHPTQIKNFITQLRLAGMTDFRDVPKMQKLVLVSRNDTLVDSSCSEIIANKWNCPIRYNDTAGHDLSFDDPNWIVNTVAAEYLR